MVQARGFIGRNGKSRKAAVAEARQRAGRKNGKGYGNGNGGGKGNRRSMRGSSDIILAQGVGAIPEVPFGMHGYTTNWRHGFDATNPLHMPLPRSIGEYTVIRTTKILTTNSRFVMLGAMMGEDTGAGPPTWLSACGIHAVNSNNPVNGTDNTTSIDMPLSLAGGATVCPAALTVQVMNGGALLDTVGIIAGGRSKSQMNIANDTRTYVTIGDAFISFMSPRLMSAAKLALRGVKCSAVPFNMSALSDFRSISPDPGAGFTWNDPNIGFQGLSPIIIYQNQATPILLNYLITMEWRTRFDIGNPAASVQRHHPITSESHWNSAVAAITATGAGMEDIVESVAAAGRVLGKGFAALT